MGSHGMLQLSPNRQLPEERGLVMLSAGILTDQAQETYQSKILVLHQC